MKTLAEDDPWLDDTAAWVERSRKLAKEKELAEKRVRIQGARCREWGWVCSFVLVSSLSLLLAFKAKLLEEMDEEFGVSTLVEQEFKDSKKVSSSICPLYRFLGIWCYCIILKNKCHDELVLKKV